MSGTQDITGGLPRHHRAVRGAAPKDPAIIAEIDGAIEFGERKRGSAPS